MNWKKSLFRARLELNEEAANMVWSPDIGFEHLLKLEKMEGIGGGRTSKSSFFRSEKIDYLVYGVQLQLTFSCYFNFAAFPFDSHVCPMEFGERLSETNYVTYNPPQILYGIVSHKTGEPPLILSNLTFTYEVHLQSLPAFQKSNSYGYTYSYTGILMKIERISFGQLMSGYYYPTASFALLSMVSFLIQPDKVSVCN